MTENKSKRTYSDSESRHPNTGREESMQLSKITESYYLARPPTTYSTLVLQVQRIVNNHGQLVYDVNQNTPPIRKFFKKVKSFNNAVASIIPDPAHDNHQHRTTKTPSININHCSFAIHDSESSKHSIAQISKYGISFSAYTTPLLANHSRLDRYEQPHPLLGPVTWNLTKDRAGYKITDKTTNIVIGKWRRKSTLRSIHRRRSLNDHDRPFSPGAVSFSTDIKYNEMTTEQFDSIGLTASSLYFSGISKKTPFFSGEFAAASPVQDDKMTWCLVVRGSVVATMKGYELHILQPPPSIAAMTFLDEFSKSLRMKHISSTEESLQTGFSDPIEPHSGNASISGSSSSSPTPNKKQQPPAVSKPKGSITSFNRLRFSDGIIMSAMSLMLNLDDRAAEGNSERLRSTSSAPVSSNTDHKQKSKSRFKIPSFMKAMHA